MEDYCDDFNKLHAGRKLGCLEMTDHSNPVDIDRISGIIRINSFAATDHLDPEETETSEHGTGPWMMPSYLNHSCIEVNCFTISIGDFMFVRACKDVQVGEELLVQYISPEKPFEQRRQCLEISFQMECTCRLCQAERKEPEAVRKRLNVIDKILDGIDMMNGGPKEVALLEKLLVEVKNRQTEFNYLAYRIQNALFLISPGFDLSIMEELYSTYRRTGDLYRCLAIAAGFGKDKTTKWRKTAQKLAKILYGDERVVDLFLMM